MVRRFMFATIALVSLALTSLGHALASPAQTLNQAFTQYSEAQLATERDLRIEKFKRAQRLFESAVEQGVQTPSLFANLGTAALQAENLGVAVLAFRRALLRDPDHPQALQNLAHTRSLLPNWVPRPMTDSVLDSFFFWHKSMPLAEQSGAAALCFLFAALGFAVAIRWRSALARNLALLPVLLWLGLMVSLLLELQSNKHLQAVVMQEETVARAADSVNAPVRFAEALPAGTEVEVMEFRDRWARIVLSNGRDAWIGRVSLALIEDNKQ